MFLKIIDLSRNFNTLLTLISIIDQNKNLIQKTTLIGVINRSREFRERVIGLLCKICLNVVKFVKNQNVFAMLVIE